MNRNVGHRDCGIVAVGRQAWVLQQTATLGARRRQVSRSKWI